MFREIVLIFGLVSIAHGCPASGSLISNPSFTFSFSPPLGWTFFTTNGTQIPYAGQQSSSSVAQQRMNSDVTAAILLSAQKMGISTVGWSWALSGYTPATPIFVIDDGNTEAKTGTYVPGLGAVLQVRGTPETSKTDYVVSMTIRVTSNNGIYFQSQWQSFSDQVFSVLSIQYNVKFRSAVTIS